MARKHQMTLTSKNGFQEINLGPMEIWDGADLALLRETLSRLIGREGNARVSVDMSSVKYVPSGFFGMLFDWTEQGASIYLDSPCKRIRNMVWFRQFLSPMSNDRFRLEPETVATNSEAVTISWGDDRWQNEDDGSDEHSLVSAGTDEA